ncbi:hypothetical protein K1719_026824 [Acacia pycnantha]|nr:hypothetical protein K1719_026824 [Acacia pycnantha]
MQHLKNPTKTQSLISFILVCSSFGVVYLLVSLLAVRTSRVVHVVHSSSSQDVAAQTSLDHVVFGIASSMKSWPKRKEYMKLWWKPNQMRGCVFVESLSAEEEQGKTNGSSSLPPLCVSEDTSRFRYTYRGGSRSAIRVARVVAETVALNHSDVRWYVFGDDDTVFFTENLLKILSKYDHELWYYIGAHSESYEQNRFFGFGMAFGGAGFAISSSLAKVLAKVFDSCIERYPHLYGSDSRVYSCLTELGVGLTHEPGFHQVDMHGNMFGLLAAHPVTPLLSLHHMDYTDPIFPNMTRTHALGRLFEAANVDSQRMLQQTVCYDSGKGNPFAAAFTFNKKDPHPDHCKRPTIFHLDSLSSGEDVIISNYTRHYQNCSYDPASPRKLEAIKVVTNKLDLSIKQLQAPRRQCCDVLPSTASDLMEITIRECKEDELIHMH